MSANSDQFDSSLIGQRQLRLSKLQKLVELGVNPYPAKAQKQHDNAQVVNEFANFENKTVTLSGRVGAKRGHGKLMFMDLIDDSGRIQVYLKDDTLQATDVSDKESQYLGFEHLDLVDVADYIQVTGQIVKTERGEISIAPEKLRLLAKTIRPLPANLEDKEERFRRRYVDMKVHPEIKELMKRRAAFWQAHREFFNSRGFHEVNIPVLEHVPGGGDAVPFVTHMNAIDEDFFLRISHELPLKRLIGAGFEKVYDIGTRFRNEGLSDEHLPEHVAMEFYWAYADWKDGMQMIQDLYNHIIKMVYPGQTKFQIREFEVEFKPQWDVIDFNEIMKEKFGIKDIYSVEIEEVKELLTQNKIEFERSINIPRGVDALWKQVRKGIAGPAFLINHPKYLSPLQKPSLDNPNMVERFQPIIAGSELGNGWSEVNDPVDQYQRFLEQQQLRDAGDAEAQWLDVDYVEMLEYGMAPTFGYGHSERVFWFLENVVAREGVPFPQLKQDFDELTKKIYPEVEFKQKVQHDSKKRAQEKIVIVISKDVQGWQFANTVGHLSTYLGAKVGKQDLLQTDNFTTADGAIPANAKLAIIIKQATSNEELQALANAAKNQKLLHLGFVKEMLEFHTDAEVQAAVSGKTSDQLEYLGVGVYGSIKEVDALTAAFKLWE